AGPGKGRASVETDVWGDGRGTSRLTAQSVAVMRPPRRPHPQAYVAQAYAAPAYVGQPYVPQRRAPVPPALRRRQQAMAVPRRGPALSLPTITLSPALVRHGVFGLKAIAGVLAGATVALAVMSYDTRPVVVPAPPPVTPAAELFPPGNVTIVYRRLAAPKIAARLEATKITARLEETEQLELAGEGIDPAQASYYERPVHTVSYVNPEPARARSIFEVTRAAISTVLTKVGAFVALRPKESTDLDAPIPPRRRSGSIMNEVDDYLWEVYQRLPVKKDGTGDFTWKDPAAARRMGLALQDYVIGGMDPEFREQLYHAGKAMDAAGLQWSMLSAFRDDYRQRLASGFN